MPTTLTPLRFSRREFLTYAGTGVAAIGLAAQFDDERHVEALASGTGARRAKAKSVIFCFMEGGQSHLDLFDPKPVLAKCSGQPIPSSVLPKTFITAFGTEKNGLMPTRRTFKQYGHSGLSFSDLLPCTAQRADDFAMVRSCYSDAVTHRRAIRVMKSGNIAAGPSLGSRIASCLGSGDRNLPGFIVMKDDQDAFRTSLDKETRATRKLYGLDERATAPYASMCLTARRLVERGVRFVELHHGSGAQWDAHHDLDANHTRNCRSVDKPVAALIADLKSRGMLEETLVIWATEFGRTPFFQGTSDEQAGRDHNPWGFTVLMAGGGVKGGQVIGATDDFGLQAVDEPHDVRDIHASTLWLLGIHESHASCAGTSPAPSPPATSANLITKLWT